MWVLQQNKYYVYRYFTAVNDPLSSGDGEGCTGFSEMYQIMGYFCIDHIFLHRPF